MRFTTTFAFALVLGAGCMTDSPEDELGEVDQEVTGHTGHVLSGTEDDTMSLGSTSGRACFLSGVAGNITTWPAPTAGLSAGVGVRQIGGNWELYINTLTSGQKLTAWARCINNSTLTAPVTWTTNQAPAVIAPVATGRYCFLTELTTSRVGFTHGAFQSPGDSVTVTTSGSNWVLSGSVFGKVTATARCITVAQNLGQFFNWANPGTGLNTIVPMVPSEDGAAACFLTQLAGELDDGSDWWQGMYVKHNTSYFFYDSVAKDGTGGRFRCVK